MKPGSFLDTHTERGKITRFRRLRMTDALRSMVRETELSKNDFIYPLFVLPGNKYKGGDLILTCFAKDAAKMLKSSGADPAEHFSSA